MVTLWCAACETSAEVTPLPGCGVLHELAEHRFFWCGPWWEESGLLSDGELMADDAQ